MNCGGFGCQLDHEVGCASAGSEACAVKVLKLVRRNPHPGIVTINDNKGSTGVILHF